MDGLNPTSTSPDDLYGAIGMSVAPLIFDVRRRAGFDADGRIPVGALPRATVEVGRWAHRVPASRSVLVYCAQGHELSHGAAPALQVSGIDARHLEGGIARRGDPLS
jgi:rhodanese-related sulfurtransferase